MTMFHAVFLGILQGLTEFLPVSSSGHLVLAEQLLNIHINPQDLQNINILLHGGTLLALLLVYRKTWMSLLLAPINNDIERSKQLVLLVIATVPGGLIGLLFEDVIAQYFHTLSYVGIAFAVTGCVLIAGECSSNKQQTLWHRLLHPTEREPHKLTTRSAFFIGIAQALALIPGISRSGCTISAGRMMGLERKDALDFSFLMAVPIIAGASLFTVIDLVAGRTLLPTLDITLTAAGTSFATSVIAIIFLRTFVTRHSLAWFAPYLFILAGVTIAHAV